MFNPGPATAAVLLFLGLASTPCVALPFNRPAAIVVGNPLTLIVDRSQRKKMSPRLEQIRKRLIGRRSVSLANLRSLADAGDGLGAFTLAKRLSNRDDPRLASDALHYYAEAALLGRAYAVRPMLLIVAKTNITFRPSHLSQAERALLSWAKRGNSVASNGLIELYGSGRPFGLKTDEVKRLLERRVKMGDGEAAHRLAIARLSETPSTAATKEAAVRYLEIAARKGNFGTRISATNMLVQLRAEPPLAVNEVTP
jgi:hypothetical protein